jgi:hypothetical protein
VSTDQNAPIRYFGSRTTSGLSKLKFRTGTEIAP